MSESVSQSRVSADLATFVADLTIDEVPDAAIELAKRAFVDTVGVTLAGVAEGAGETTMAAIEAWGEGETSLVGRDGCAPLPSAVLANATAGHGIDFDDVSWGMDGHPSVPIVAPILALGDREDVSGETAITAYVAGFEAQCYLAAPISPDHYEAGWHATATFGTFGSAAASARILGLSAAETERALNIAASMPAGLKRNFGSMTKPLHAGQAARSGVTAALLADAGMTANDAAIAGDRGFFDLYGAGGDVDRTVLPTLGNRWAILDDGIHVKKYPSCYYTHTALAATIELVEDQDLDPDDVRDVTVRSSKGAAETLQHDDPETGLEAKFSMPYCIAYAIVNRQVDLEAFDDAAVGESKVQQVREVVTLEIDPDVAYDANAATVELETADGEVFTRSRTVPPGHHTDPLSERELRQKFLMCARRALSDEKARTAYQAVNSLDEEADIGSLLTALSPSAQVD